MQVVFEGSAAASAGVAPGDAILTINGEPVAEDLGAIATALRKKDSMTLTLRRVDASVYTVALAKRDFAAPVNSVR